ncbi:MAG: NAD(P)-dependent oxidoreductase [Polyangiaceae bacterium]|nr:NAD(P)-dependent oxidoreductase [Polyangiaceae bacterium]
MTSFALVTGAPGWMGTALVRSLAQGLPDVPALRSPRASTVRCLVLPDADASDLEELGHGVQLVRGDLRDESTLVPLFEGAEGATVFHAAGVIHPPGRTSLFTDVNVLGTQRLLALAEQHGVRRFVYISSNSPIGVNPFQSHTFDEASPYDPYMGYGKSKMAAEQLVLKAESRGKLETVIMRPPWFYGPGQPPRQSLFFQLIRDGKVPIVGDGQNRRSMGYIDNLCQGALLCASVPEARGQIYWIADDRPYTMNEIVDTIERVLERDFQVKVAHKRMRMPYVLGQIAQAVDATLQAAGLYHQKMHVLSEMNKTIACTVQKAKRELGYRPTVELEEGMRRSIRWLLDRGVKL